MIYIALLYAGLLGIMILGGVCTLKSDNMFIMFVQKVLLKRYNKK